MTVFQQKLLALLNELKVKELADGPPVGVLTRTERLAWEKATRAARKLRHQADYYYGDRDPQMAAWYGGQSALLRWLVRKAGIA